MLEFLNKPVAGASSCSAMEAETIQKNAVSPKNQRSRRNQLNVFKWLFIIILTLFTSVNFVQAQGYTAKEQISSAKILLDSGIESVQMAVLDAYTNYHEEAQLEIYKYVISNKNFSEKIRNLFASSINKLAPSVRAKIGNTSETSTQTTQTTTAKPSGKIEKVWLEHNVMGYFVNYEKGMNIHVHFTVNNLKGANAVHFMTSYYFSDGSRACQSHFNKTMISPSYDNAEYKDVTDFNSYSNLISGLPSNYSNTKSINLKVKVTLYGDTANGMVILDESDFVSFTLNK